MPKSPRRMSRIAEEWMFFSSSFSYKGCFVVNTQTQQEITIDLGIETDSSQIDAETWFTWIELDISFSSSISFQFRCMRWSNKCFQALEATWDECGIVCVGAQARARTRRTVLNDQTDPVSFFMAITTLNYLLISVWTNETTTCTHSTLTEKRLWWSLVCGHFRCWLR